MKEQKSSKKRTIIDEDKKYIRSKSTVSMNFWICSPKIFEYTEPYFTSFLTDPNNHQKNEIYLPFVAQEMMKNKLIRVKVINSNSEWFGVTYYKDKDIAVKTLDKLVNEGKYPSILWNL